MHDVLADVNARWEGREPVAIATVIATYRSAPRRPGASMVVDTRGDVIGSVSGGCVESSVYEIAQEVLDTGRPRLERFGVSDDDAFAVGLSCGGVIDVFVEAISRRSFPRLGEFCAHVTAGRPIALATVVEHPDPGLVGRRWMIQPGAADAETPDQVIADARQALAAGTSGTHAYGADATPRGTGMRVFIETFLPRPRLIIFGAIDFAASMATIGDTLGYQVTVCDARPVFATTERLPSAHDVVVDWPHRYLAAELQTGRVDDRTALVVLTHDAKFDVPLLDLALRIPTIGYVGAMGSRRTHEVRLAALREKGLAEEQLSRLHSPIGLDIGAQSPMETAVSIAAEIIAHHSGRSGERLSRTTGSIHS